MGRDETTTHMQEAKHDSPHTAQDADEHAKGYVETAIDKLKGAANVAAEAVGLKQHDDTAPANASEAEDEAREHSRDTAGASTGRDAQAALGGKVQETVQAAAEKLDDANEDAGRAVADVKEGDAKGALGHAAEAAREYAHAAADVVLGTARDVAEVVGLVHERKEGDAAQDTTGDEAEEAKDAAKDTAAGARDTIADKADELRDQTSEKVGQAKDAAKSKAADARDAISDNAEDAKQEASEKAGQAKAAAKSTAADARAKAGEATEAAAEQAGRAQDALAAKAVELKDAVVEKAGQAKEVVAEKARDVGEWAAQTKDEAKSKAGDARDAAADKAEDASEKVGQAKGAAKAKAANAHDAISDEAKDAAARNAEAGAAKDSFTTQAQDLGNEIKQALLPAASDGSDAPSAVGASAPMAEGAGRLPNLSSAPELPPADSDTPQADVGPQAGQQPGQRPSPTQQQSTGMTYAEAAAS